jgi:preprotein translocase subunit SecD
VTGPAAWLVVLKTPPHPTAALKEASTRHIGGQLAFVIDSEVVSAPGIVAPIDSGRLQIALLPLGNRELDAEAVSLRTPPLPVLLRAGETRIEHRHTVSPGRLLGLAAVGAAIGAGVGSLVARRRRSATPEG